MKHNASIQTSMPPRVSFTRLACPPENPSLWQEHPRVFLTPDQEGKASCPYCGRKYQASQVKHNH